MIKEHTKRHGNFVRLKQIQEDEYDRYVTWGQTPRIPHANESCPPSSNDVPDIEVHPLGELHLEVEQSIRHELSYGAKAKVARLDDIQKITKKEVTIWL